jgi:hypothetical protein
LSVWAVFFAIFIVFHSIRLPVPRCVGAHRKHSDFTEESKTELVLWSALAYVPSDKAKKFWVAPAALAFAPLNAPIAPAQTAQNLWQRKVKSRAALGGEDSEGTHLNDRSDCERAS